MKSYTGSLQCIGFWVSLTHWSFFGTSLCKGEMVANWQATLVDSGAISGRYKVKFEWDHDNDEYIQFPTSGDQRVKNPIDDPRCQGNSKEKAKDGIEWWMPRLHWKQVSQEITAATGIEVVDVSWQPCGHKEITICHAESHYDIHLYYVKKEKLQQMRACEIGVEENPRLPVCQDSKYNEANHEYFRLMKNDIPVQSLMINGELEPMNFCVDPSSAIMQSGIHYGDVRETNNEWRRPVTTMGSHDCQLMFFEPMVSWNWIANRFANGTAFGWPLVEVTDIKYNKKTFEALPNRWSVEVRGGCRLPVPRDCHITLIVEGSPCPAAGCTVKRECGTDVIDCTTGAVYQSPTTTTTGTASITTRTITSTTTITLLSTTGVTTATMTTVPLHTTASNSVDASFMLSGTNESGRSRVSDANESSSSRGNASTLQSNSSSPKADEISAQEGSQSAIASTSNGSALLGWGGHVNRKLLTVALFHYVAFLSH
eukprot:gnl/MRDRNA2_/MRDRNA2_28694_c0_seq2.p1 gnl/MRDRNA2_/MRDRNA2_28694_c0~~gnl/MRDRNA2_/MRDRNA2_28694_c0_seq2.p1  ORF type:complete len:484 (-),score=69.03 gnl/MRDRNA2_/MRDRNA2_28694_c0_seq2:235-1686(-)